MFHNKLNDGCLNGPNYYVQNKKNDRVYKNWNCSLCDGASLLDDIVCLQPFPAEGGVRIDYWTISDLFNFDDTCDIHHINDPIFGNCDLIEDIINDDFTVNTTDFPEFWINSTFELLPEQPPSVSSTIFLVFMIISIICLFLHNTLFILLYKGHNLHSRNLFCMTMCLFFALFIFITGANMCSTFVSCYVLTVFDYFAFMSAYLWMNVISLDICKTFLSPNIRSHSMERFSKYCLYAFGMSVILTLCALMVDQLAPTSGVTP